MQQPTNPSNQYGVPINPNAFSPTQSINPHQFNPPGMKQMVNGDEHLDNINLSDTKAASDSPNPHISSDTRRPNSKFLSNFSQQLDNPTLSNVPLNGVYQQNSDVISSYNYNPNTAGDSVNVQPPIGTQRTTQYVPSPTNMQTQFTSTGPSSTMTKSLPPGVITGITPQPQSGAQSYTSTNGDRTSGNMSTQPPNSLQQPLPSKESVFQSLPSRDNTIQSQSSVNGSFPLTLSTNVQPTVSHTNYEPQGPTTFSNSTQPTMSTQQEPSTLDGSAQPSSGNNVKQTLPQSTSNYPPASGSSYPLQPDSTSPVQPPMPISNSFAQPPPTFSNSMRPPSSSNSFQPLKAANSSVGGSLQAPISSSNSQAPTSASSFQAPASANSFQAPTSASNFQAPASANSFQAPTSASNFQAPASANSFQAPTSANSFQAPTSASNFQAPASANSFQAPTSANSFQAPTSAKSFQAPTSVNNFQAPTTAANSFQAPSSASSVLAPTSANSFQAPTSANSFQAPASASSFQAPTSANSFQAPTSANSFQAPTSANSFQAPSSASSVLAPTSANSFQAPTSANSFQAPASASSVQAPTSANSFQAPTSVNNFQAPTTAANIFQAPTSANSFQAPTSANSFQAPASASSVQAPTSANSFQAPTSANSFQAPTSANSFQAPTSANSFQAPTSANSFQAPTSAGSFQAPTSAGSFQAPSSASRFQAPTSANSFQAPASANSFQAPTSANSLQAPTSAGSFQAPSSASRFQAPTSANSFQAPTSAKNFPAPQLANSFQVPPSTNNSGAPPLAKNYQGHPTPAPPLVNSYRPPTTAGFQAPPLANSFQAPAASKAPLRPPASAYSFQSPASAPNFQSPLATNAPKLPPMPSAVPAFPQNVSYPQQNARPPPNTYTQTNKTAPLNNGMPPMPGASQYQQPSSIPPQAYSEPSSYVNSYVNQMPPRMQPPSSQTTGSYPSMPGHPTNQQAAFQQTLDQFSNMSVTHGMNKMWGYEPHDLLNTRDILPSTKVEPPPIRLPQNLPESINCSRDLFRCTLTKIPESKSLLEKSRLPLGLLIHPFKDINNLKVIKNMIVRCRQCRTYINPFVQFLDSKQWKCNICFRTNEIHEQFLYDRNTEMFGDPYRRPEIQSATVEYLATSDYTVRDPPQPAMYLFLLDVSQIAAQSGYLYTVCEVLLNQLKSMPGDRRTSVAIITYDSAVHFYSLAEGQTQPSQLILTDIDDIFLPSPENILVNLNECYDMIVDLLKQLPEKFKDNLDSGSALGPALQAAFKLLQPTGGRITIFQTCLPNRGPGALEARENPNQRSNDQPPHMNPATDFYKKIALECTSFYIAVDLFILNSQYVDVATLSGVAKFSSGCIHHIPLYSGKNMSHVYQLDRMFSRYLTRKIGFESVMRIRCTKGLSIHTFHGNFFVRSTDLLALPNVNPDAGYGIQISIDEALTHIQYACFQVALLYTSSKGDRRIRVHTLCLPVVSNVNDVLVGADQQCIAGLLAKMAVDRSLQHSLSDAREAFLNVVCDVLSTYKITQTGHLTGSLLAPSSLKLLPLYVLALLKHPAFRIGQSTRLDDRVFAMTEMKCLPLNSLMLSIYPELYPIHSLDQDPTFEWNDVQVPTPRILQLSAERLQATGTYLLNLPDTIIILVRHGTSPAVCSALFGFQSVAQMPEILYELPQLETPLSLKLSALIGYLNDDKAYVSPVKVMKDSSTDRMEFYDKLIEDKNGGGMSYYEFLQRIREQVKSY